MCLTQVPNQSVAQAAHRELPSTIYGGYLSQAQIQLKCLTQVPNQSVAQAAHRELPSTIYGGYLSQAQIQLKLKEVGPRRSSRVGPHRQNWTVTINLTEMRDYLVNGLKLKV